MTNKLPILLATLALGLSACSSNEPNAAASAANAKLESQGLPFRWSAGEGGASVMRMMPLPVASASKADAKLSAEILDGIAKKEKAKGRTGALLREVRQMSDGREVWVLQSLGSGIAYVVGLGTPVRVQGPYEYAP